MFPELFFLHGGVFGPGGGAVIATHLENWETRLKIADHARWRNRGGGFVIAAAYLGAPTSSYSCWEDLSAEVNSYFLFLSEVTAEVHLHLRLRSPGVISPQGGANGSGTGRKETLLISAARSPRAYPPHLLCYPWMGQMEIVGIAHPGSGDAGAWRFMYVGDRPGRMDNKYSK